MRRLTSILLVIAMLAPSGVAYLALRHQRQQVRRGVKHFLETKANPSDLVHFRFSLSQSKEDLKWEHEKEFEFQGEMYDVVSKVIQGDSVEYWCWWDHEETKLNQQLRQLTAKAMTGNPEAAGIHGRMGWIFQTHIGPPRGWTCYILNPARPIDPDIPTIVVEKWLQTPPTPPPDRLT